MNNLKIIYQNLKLIYMKMKLKILLRFILICFFFIPLIQPVYAYENLNTYVDVIYPNMDTILDTPYDATYTYRELLDHIISLDTSNVSTYKLFAVGFTTNTNHTSITKMYFYFYDKTALKSGVNTLQLIPNATATGFFYASAFTNGYNMIFSLNSSNLLSDIEACITSNTNCTNLSTWYTESKGIGKQILNNFPSSADGRNGWSGTTNSSSDSNVYVYDSISTMYISYDGSSSNKYFKSVKYNSGDTIYSTGDIIQTYKMLYPVNNPPEPDDPNDPVNPPEPDDPVDPNDPYNISDSIYWFKEFENGDDILENIYILLFIYCISMIIFKINDKLTKNRNRRL